MRPLHICLIASCLSAGCSCSETGIEGRPDSSDDPGADVVEDDAPVPCPDRDGDGYLDAACGGNDCDDTRPDVHPMAEEACLDGIDGDCDGIVDGPVLMREPLQLSHPPDFEDRSADIGAWVVAWTGSSYLVGWHDRELPSGDTSSHMGYLDPAGERIIEELPSYISGHLAWTGSGFGVTWSDTGDLFFNTATTSGEPILADTCLLSGGWNDSAGLVWTGSDFILTYFGETFMQNLRYARVSMEGEIVTGPFLATDLTAWGLYPTLFGLDQSWTGSAVGAVWSAAGESVAVIGFSMLDDGISGPGSYLRVAEVESSFSSARIAWSGTEFGIAWDAHEPPELHFTRISASGEEIVGDSVIGGGDIEQSDLTWTGSEYGLMLRGEDTGGRYVALARVDPGGNLVDGEARIPIGDFGASPSIVWSGSEFAVGWGSWVDHSWEAFVARIGLCD